MTDGILPVNKEAGFTSHDVVAALRRILGIRRIGHTGTLDPMATGVLPVAVGQGTKLVELLTEKKKTYRTVMRLGVVTDTQDCTGQVLSRSPVLLTEEEILAAAASFEGEQMQVPPMYSAIKVDGQKLYELARKGQVVERSPRPVTFYEIRVVKTELPLVTMEVTCSKGTYIRTLCHDLGEKLGCGACMEELTRLASGDFLLQDCYTLEEIRSAASDGSISGMIITPEQVLKGYPALYAPESADRLILNGNPVQEEFFPDGEKESPVRLYRSNGVFAGLYEWREDKGKYYPVRVFLPG